MYYKHKIYVKSNLVFVIFWSIFINYKYCHHIIYSNSRYTNGVECLKTDLLYYLLIGIDCIINYIIKSML